MPTPEEAEHTLKVFGAIMGLVSLLCLFGVPFGIWCYGCFEDRRKRRCLTGR